MPTYEYVCPKCHHAFEKRLIGGGAGLIFKGTGFYITDYKNKPRKAPEKSGGDGAKAAPAKADPKPAAAAV